MQIDEYYKYSFFADLSYVNWISNKNYTYIDIRAATSDPDTQKGPESIVKDFFITKGWEISNVQENDDVGFKASLYSDGTEKILAIAGTENLTDWDENLGRIGGIGVAIKQAVSLYNYIMRLTAQKGKTDVVQLRWREEAIGEGDPVPNNGNCIEGQQHGTSTTYYWLERIDDAIGLGEIGSGEKISITGHSLGGHLAAFALRLFPDLINKAVSFNAPGFDPWSSQGKTDQIVNELFAEYLDHDPKTFTELENENRLHVLESEDSVPGNDDDLVSGIECGIKSAEEIFG